MEFAEKLIALRKSRELTQEQLAEQINVSRQSISKWESGGYDPSCSGQMHGQQTLCGNEPFLCLLSAYG